MLDDIEKKIDKLIGGNSKEIFTNLIDKISEMFNKADEDFLVDFKKCAHRFITSLELSENEENESTAILMMNEFINFIMFIQKHKKFIKLVIDFDLSELLKRNKKIMEGLTLEEKMILAENSNAVKFLKEKGKKIKWV